MANAPSYSVQAATIPAGEYLDVSRAGNVLTCLEGSDWFKVALDAGPETRFEQGLTFRPPEGFTRVRLRNPHDAAITVQLGIGRGDMVDNRLVIEREVPVATASPDILTTATVAVPAGQSVQIADADQARVEMAVRNLSIDQRVWMRADSATVADGWALDAKEGAIITASAAVHIYNPTAVSIAVATFQTRRA